MTVCAVARGLKIHTSGVLTLYIEAGVLTCPMTLLAPVGVLTLDVESRVLTFPMVLVGSNIGSYFRYGGACDSGSDPLIGVTCDGCSHPLTCDGASDL